jgi:hypothetical protein
MTVGDVLNAALSEYDAAVSVCPVNNPAARRGNFDQSQPCPVCNARQDQNCGRDTSASYSFIKSVRALAARATGTNDPSTEGGRE